MASQQPVDSQKWPIRPFKDHRQLFTFRALNISMQKRATWEFRAEEKEVDKHVSGLEIAFKRCYRYTGTINMNQIEESLNQFEGLEAQNDTNEDEIILANAHFMKLQYAYIWSNFSKMEKMLLFDLADDGLMNFKNRFLINRLKMKGLIVVEPTPKVFTPSFQYFLKYSINEEETLLLERELGKYGQWKKTRYLILLLLLPLAAFMFISKGISIEKVLAVLTGVIAVFSGAVRLMDMAWFSKSGT